MKLCEVQQRDGYDHTVPWIKIQIKLANEVFGVLVVDREETYIFVPHAGLFFFDELQSKDILVGLCVDDSNTLLTMGNSMPGGDFDTEETLGDHFHREVDLNFVVIDLVFFFEHHPMVIPDVRTSECCRCQNNWVSCTGSPKR